MSDGGKLNWKPPCTSRVINWIDLFFYRIIRSHKQSELANFYRHFFSELVLFIFAPNKRLHLAFPKSKFSKFVLKMSFQSK